MAAESAGAALASSAHLAEVDHLWQPLVLVVAAAMVPALRSMLRATATIGPAAVAAAIGMGWFALAWVRHLLDLTPRWGGHLPSGLGHAAWDVGYHAPALVLAVVGTLLSTPPASTSPPTIPPPSTPPARTPS